MVSSRAILLPALSALLLLGACMSPTDPDTPRIRISEPSRYFLRTVDLSPEDVGYDIAQLDDGGYIITGYTWMKHTASRDVLLLRTDNEGKQIWMKTFGGVNADEGYSVSPTLDGGFVITGSTESYTNGFNDVWLVKTDENGAMLWSKSFGYEGRDSGQEVRECKSGGYIIAGYSHTSSNTGSQAWVIRTDELGNKIWDKKFGSSERDLGSSIKETPDGHFIVAGSTEVEGNGSSAIWLFEIDVTGTMGWQRTIDGDNSKSSFHFVRSPDGSSAVAGHVRPRQGQSSNMLFVKADASGDLLTERVLHDNAIARSIENTSDGGYIVCGYTDPYGGDGSDIVLVRLDINGNTLWKKEIGGSRLDRAMSITTTADGGFILTGTTYSFGSGDQDLLLIKTDASGVYEE